MKDVALSVSFLAGFLLKFSLCAVEIPDTKIVKLPDTKIVKLPDTKIVHQTIEDSFACRKNNPALSVSIVKNGKIVYADGFGVNSLKTKEPVTNTTLFGIASLTKGFTSALLSKLTDQNRNYSLNSRVAEFYKNYPVFDGYLRSKFATIRDLLSHRMGIPMHNFIRFDSTLNRKNLIRRLMELKPRGRFRDSFYYSNIMYGQAARLAEKIGKATFENLIQNHFFQKLGMTDSDFFTTANESLTDLAQGYLDVYGELHPVPFELSRRWSDLCGANCILSSAVDMAKWMMFQLSHGKNQDGRRVMSEDALEDTHRPENVLAKSSLSKYYTKPNVPETFSQTGYALGWRTGHYRGYNIITHTGSSWGYKNMITLFPDMNVGIYTAMTGDDEDFLYRYSLHQYLADMYLGVTPWLNTKSICSFPEPWLPVKPKRSKPTINKNLMPKRKLDDYLGIYENPAYGKIDVFILDEANNKNKLIAEYGYTDLILYPKSSEDDFFFETDGIAAMLINFGTIQFKSTNGVIDKMRIPSFEPKDPPIFKRIDKPRSKSPVDPTDPETVVPKDPLVPSDTLMTKIPPKSTGQEKTMPQSKTGVSKGQKTIKEITKADPDLINTETRKTRVENVPDNLSENQPDLSNTETVVPSKSKSTDQGTKTGVKNVNSDLPKPDQSGLVNKVAKSTEKVESKIPVKSESSVDTSNVPLKTVTTKETVQTSTKKSRRQRQTPPPSNIQKKAETVTNPPPSDIQKKAETVTNPPPSNIQKKAETVTNPPPSNIQKKAETVTNPPPSNIQKKVETVTNPPPSNIQKKAETVTNPPSSNIQKKAETVPKPKPTVADQKPPTPA
ncbi:Hypothetical predicted protein [Mytilus galloprovincialis]|uniref:Beta-lactamase-related domain-containing protein n=1 Tax=Mytilus galloprovincialis TaxID=29158 RepID=A0A8B6F1H4_MYTGA|nr:Hypothetical predicted protein [Mytilus galloprovincialis]